MRVFQFLAVLLFALLSLGLNAQEYKGPCKQSEGSGKCEIAIVSLMSLITTPERFHQKRVSVHGFMTAEFEDVSLAFVKGVTTRCQLFRWQGNSARMLSAEVRLDSYLNQLLRLQ